MGGLGATNIRHGTASAPVPVDVSDRVAREVGVAGSPGITIPVVPTISAALYAINDNVGDLMTFAGAARGTGWGGVIKSLAIIDDASQSAQLELWLFNQTFTAGVDNAVWTPVEAELENLVGILSTSDGIWYTGGAVATACIVESSIRYDCLATSLFGRLVTRSAMTPAAVDDISVILGLLQD